MEIDNTIKELILENMKKYYIYEKDFYKLPGIKFPDNNWIKFKNGETDIAKIGSARLMSMLSRLFTPFELTLIAKAQTNYYSRNDLKIDMTFPTYFDIFKKEILQEWLNNPKDVVAGTDRLMNSDGNWSSGYLKIALKSTKIGFDSYLCEMRFGKANFPNGSENIVKWLKGHLDEIR